MLFPASALLSDLRIGTETGLSSVFGRIFGSASFPHDTGAPVQKRNVLERSLNLAEEFLAKTHVLWPFQRT